MDNSLLTLDCVFRKGQKDTSNTYIHQAPYDAVFFDLCRVSKTEPVLFVHISPLLNYISLAHGLKFCKAFLKILLMVAILCQKVHLACKFKHGLQIFKSWAYCSNKHFQQGGEKLQGIHFQHNSSSGTSPPLAPNKTTTKKERESREQGLGVVGRREKGGETQKQKTELKVWLLHLPCAG